MTNRSLNEWLAWQENAHPIKIDMGLGRTRTVAERLGLLTLNCTLVTVAGTNGKGSSVTMLECIMRNAGYRTGTYMSPHVDQYNERIRLSNKMADDADIVAAFEAIEVAREDISLSYFEYGTLAALYLFRQHNVDIAILEVGLGGRLDATNIMDADIALLTSIGVDHAHFLGTERNQIALEKAAIARKDRPVICSDPTPPESLAPFFSDLGANYLQLGRDFQFSRHYEGWDWQGLQREYECLPVPRQQGDHQYQNIAGVLAVVEQLPAQFSISEESIKAALLSVQVTARFERFAGSPEVIYDVAHNPDSMQALGEMLADNPALGDTIAVIGVMADKDLGKMLPYIAPYVQQWVATSPDLPRAMDANTLAQQLTEVIPEASVHLAQNTESAWQQSQALAQPGDRVLVIGSFYTVAEIRRLHL